MKAVALFVYLQWRHVISRSWQFGKRNARVENASAGVSKRRLNELCGDLIDIALGAR
jgi:hypothetical protein